MCTEPLCVTVMCFVRRPKTTKRVYPIGDVDNYAKAVLDALNGVTWEDDDQIISLVVHKEYTDDTPRITLDISEYKFDVDTPKQKPRSKSRKVSKMCTSRSRSKRR